MPTPSPVDCGHPPPLALGSGKCGPSPLGKFNRSLPLMQVIAPAFNLSVVHCPIIHPPASVRRSPPRGPRLGCGLKGPARAARRTRFRQWHSTRDRGRGTSKIRLPSLTRSLPSSTRWALLTVSSGQVKMAAHWDWRLPPLQDRDPPQRRSEVAVSSTSPLGDHRARAGPHSMRLLAAS